MRNLEEIARDLVNAWRQEPECVDSSKLKALLRELAGQIEDTKIIPGGRSEPFQTTPSSFEPEKDLPDGLLKDHPALSMRFRSGDDGPG